MNSYSYQWQSKNFKRDICPHVSSSGPYLGFLTPEGKNIKFDCILQNHVGVSKIPVQQCDWLEGLMGLQKTVILTVPFYFSQRIQVKHQQRERVYGVKPRRPDKSFQVCSPSAVRRICLIPQQWPMVTRANCGQSGKLTWNSVSRCFIGSWSHRHGASMWWTSAPQNLALLPSKS